MSSKDASSLNANVGEGSQGPGQEIEHPQNSFVRFICALVDPRRWEFALYLVSLVTSLIAVGYVYGAGTFRPYGSLIKVGGSINNGLSSALYINLDKTVAKLPDQQYCAFDAQEFDKVFSTNGESTAVSALGFFLGVCAIGSFILSLVYFMIARSHFSFNADGKKAKRKRFLTVLCLDVFMIVSYLTAALVVYFGLEETINNLDKDECFVACGSCPQNFCVFQNTYTPSIRSTCPTGYIHKSTRSFADSYSAFSTALWCCLVGGAAIVLATLLLCVGEPTATYKSCCRPNEEEAETDIEMQEKASSRRSSKRDSVKSKHSTQGDVVVEENNEATDSDNNKEEPNSEAIASA